MFQGIDPAPELWLNTAARLDQRAFNQAQAPWSNLLFCRSVVAKTGFANTSKTSPKPSCLRIRRIPGPPRSLFRSAAIRKNHLKSFSDASKKHVYTEKTPRNHLINNKKYLCITRHKLEKSLIIV